MRSGHDVVLRSLTTIDGGPFSDVSPWHVVDLRQLRIGFEWRSATTHGDDGFLRAGSATQQTLIAANNSRAKRRRNCVSPSSTRFRGWYLSSPSTEATSRFFISPGPARAFVGGDRIVTGQGGHRIGSSHRCCVESCGGLKPTLQPARTITTPGNAGRTHACRRRRCLPRGASPSALRRDGSCRGRGAARAPGSVRACLSLDRWPTASAGSPAPSCAMPARLRARARAGRRLRQTG